MNKPLTKEEREFINLAFGREDGIVMQLPWPSDYVKIINQLKFAEAYWREAVKNAGTDPLCAFCGRVDNGRSQHKPDCLWPLAQDSKEDN
jgi:hypothetical protein